MSSRVKALILRQMKDREIVLQCLDELSVQYRDKKRQIIINNGVTLETNQNQVIAKFQTTNQVANQFLEELSHLYARNLHAKIQRLRQQEAELAEKKILETIKTQEQKKKALQIKRERLRLEKLRKQEERKLQQQILQKTQILKQRAEELGYEIQEEIQEEKRVLVLVRRQ